ncbi:hypothetical protein, partial [Salmonella enterica]|uniref:hypothetical protein n=1 Tax=Salmonella enterica TaxID=28901 RepID=UPI0022B72F4E|nr:hypothetical protein [Salmonella enterica]
KFKILDKNNPQLTAVTLVQASDATKKLADIKTDGSLNVIRDSGSAFLVSHQNAGTTANYKIYKNNSATALTVGTDYTISASGTSILITLIN